jgi:hypothetical protein
MMPLHPEGGTSMAKADYDGTHRSLVPERWHNAMVIILTLAVIVFFSLAT